MGSYPMGSFRVGLFSGLGIRRLAIRMERMRGRVILLRLRRGRLIEPPRLMLRGGDLITIREQRLLGIWATG